MLCNPFLGKEILNVPIRQTQIRLLLRTISQQQKHLNMPPPVIIHQTLLRHSTPDGGPSRNQSWSPRELDQLERCQDLAKKMSRFQLPSFCHKFYNNNLTQTLARRKSTKEIWGNVFHPGTPQGNNKREHYFAKSEAGQGSRFDHYYKQRENTKNSHAEGMKRTFSKRHNYNEMPSRHKGSIHT